MDDLAFTDRDMRDALSSFSTGVTIVTTTDTENRPIGMTVSSFNSVSMEPPLILWSVTKSSLSAECYKDASRFAVHVLARDQVELSNQFARAETDKFANTKYHLDKNGVPVLSDCASRFDCSQWACYEGGDHWIIVGRVESLERNLAEPLVFSGGSYAVASPLQQSKPGTTEISAEQSPIDGLLIYNLSRAYRQLADQFHDCVRQTGLTVPQWRILASLHGGARREMPGLAVRTFIDPPILQDMIEKMQEDGLCSVSSSGNTTLVVATEYGEQRHLFTLSIEQERSALGDGHTADLQQLIDLLRTVIANTDID